jgi:hypothetical protein
MKYEVVQTDQDAIKVVNHIFKKIDIDNVVVVQIPEEFISESDAYLEELQKAFTTKNIVITTDKVKFCTLQMKK